MRLGQVVVLHGRPTDTSAEQSARRERHDGQRRLVPISVCVLPGIKRDHQASKTIRFGGNGSEASRGSDTNNAKGQLHRHSGKNKDEQDSGQNNDRTTQIRLHEHQQDRNAHCKGKANQK